MKTISQILSESRERTANITYIKANPPTLGHSKVIDHVLRQPGDHYVFVSYYNDSKNNPLTVEEKINYLKIAHPKNQDIFHAASKESPTIFHAASNLHKNGYDNLHVVVGANRVDEFKKAFHDHNGKIDEKGNGFNFKSIKVSNAGNRNPDAKDVEGISTSKMREYARSGNLSEFKKGLHPNLHPHAKEIMGKVRKGMGLSEEHDSIREAYIGGEILKVGQLVECDLGIAEIIDRGPNYVTLVKDGETFKRWLKDVSLSEGACPKRSQIYKDSFIIKGYKTKHFTRELAEAFSAVNKNNSDKFALFSCAVCVDRLLGASKTQLVENFDKYSIEFERASKYLAKFGLVVEQMSSIEDILLEHAIVEGVKFSAADKLKVAHIIASAVGHTPKSTDPVDIIHDSIAHVRANKYTPEAWKLMGRLYNKATEAGIKWDKNKFALPTQKYMGLK
jgi:hypothetical protein